MAAIFDGLDLTLLGATILPKKAISFDINLHLSNCTLRFAPRDRVNTLPRLASCSCSDIENMIISLRYTKHYHIVHYSLAG